MFTINLPSQPFLGRHLGFHIFFHHSLSEGRTLFDSLTVLDYISFLFVFVYPKASLWPALGLFKPMFFFFTTGRRIDEVDVRTLNILSVDVQLYI